MERTIFFAGQGDGETAERPFVTKAVLQESGEQNARAGILNFEGAWHGRQLLTRLDRRFPLYSQLCQTGGKTWSKCDGGGLILLS